MQQKCDGAYMILVERHTMKELAVALADAERRIAEIQGIISVAVDTIYGGRLREDDLRLQKAVIASATDSLCEARRERDIVLQCLKIRNSLNTGPPESSNATKEVKGAKSQ